MSHAQTLPLDHVLSGSGDIKERVHDVVLQQIHFVDIQKTAIRLRQETGLKRFLTVDERTLNIQRADHAVFCGAQRQVDDGDGDGFGIRRIRGFATLGAESRPRR